MPICPNSDCLFRGAEQPLEQFLKNDRQLTTCFTCRKRKQDWRNSKKLRDGRGKGQPVLRVIKPLPKFKGWWPSIKSIFRREQLTCWLVDLLAEGETENRPAEIAHLCRMAPPSPSPYPQPVPEVARGERIKI